MFYYNENCLYYNVTIDQHQFFTWDLYFNKFCTDNVRCVLCILHFYGVCTVNVITAIMFVECMNYGIWKVLCDKRFLLWLSRVRFIGIFVSSEFRWLYLWKDQEFKTVEELWPTLFFIFRGGYTSSTILNCWSFQRYRPRKLWWNKISNESDSIYKNRQLNLDYIWLISL